MRSHPSTSPATLYAPGRSSSEVSYRCPGRNDSLLSVNERLAVPEARQEVMHGERISCMSANPPHAFAQTDLDALLRLHTAEGYRAASEMLTRVSQDSDVAPDAAICKVDGTSIFAQRELERLAFEIADTTTPKRLKERVKLLAQRGVHRIFCIDIQEWQVLEWNKTTNAWDVLSLDATIDDPCLIRPLLVEALLDSAKQDDEFGHAMLKRNNRIIEGALQERETKGKIEGERALLLKQMQLKFGPIPDWVRERLEQAPPAHVDEWAERILTASTLDEVFANTAP